MYKIIPIQLQLMLSTRTILKHDGLATFSKKGLTIYSPDWENSAIKFPPLCHLPFRRNISTTVTPNYVRLEPLETSHPYLFKDTKFEEI